MSRCRFAKARTARGDTPLVEVKPLAVPFTASLGIVEILDARPGVGPPYHQLVARFRRGV